MSRPGDRRRRLSRPRLPGELVDPVSVGDAAAMVGAELGLAAPLVFTRVVEAWADLVGETLAAHSHVRSVRNGVIEVRVDSPAWASEFRYHERDLVERASRLVGEGVVRAVQARVGRPDEPPDHPPDQTPHPPPDQPGAPPRTRRRE